MRQYAKWAALESEFAEYFTAIVSGWSREEVMDRIRQVVYDQSANIVWVPSRQPI